MPLGRVHQRRLFEALARLPEEITHLREPILAIAKQDQDLLGCGEADTTVLEESLKVRSESDKVSDPNAQADTLRRWAEQLSDNKDPWAGPIWFVEGFLRGCEVFGVDLTKLKPSSKPELGLRCMILTVPEGMKTKLYVAGIELSNREAQIIVIELDDTAFKEKRELLARPLPPQWPKPPHLVWEPPDALTLGATSGARWVTRHVESRLPMMSTYLCSLPTTFEVAMFANKSRGCDLLKYEPLLSSVRCK